MKILTTSRFEQKQEDKIDDILDRISKYGISSLSQGDREFLDKYAKESDGYYRIKIENSEIIFDLDKTMTYQGEFRVYGSVWFNNMRFDGHLFGKPKTIGFESYIFSKRYGEESLPFKYDLYTYIDKKYRSDIADNIWYEFERIWNRFSIKYFNNLN